MNRVKLFSDPDVFGLEAAINDWLDENKDIRIVHTNLGSIRKGGQEDGVESVGHHLFYILYTNAKTTRRKKHTAAEVAIPEDLASAVLPVKKEDTSLPLSSHDSKLEV